MKLFAVLIFVCRLSEILGKELRETRACVHSTLNLRCEEGSIISIWTILLGDSNCYSTNCCPSELDCRRMPSYSHKMHVLSSCNGRKECSIAVEYLSIGCSFLAPKNDYEIIKYNCTSTLSTTPKATSPTLATTQQNFQLSTNSFYIPTTRNHVSSNAIPGISTINLARTTPPRTTRDHSIGEARNEALNQLPEEKMQKNEEGIQKIKIVNLEPIIIPLVGGLILITLIISISCLVSRRYGQRRKVAHAYDVPAVYLQPVSYQTLSRSCGETTNVPSCSEQFETYDSIRDICLSVEDGYLKPSDLTQSHIAEEKEEVRYVMA